MNELLWDVWVDTCNCVCNVLYYILICVFVFQGQIKPLYEINPIETTDVSVIPTRTRNKWRPMRDIAAIDQESQYRYKTGETLNDTNRNIRAKILTKILIKSESPDGTIFY